MQPEPAVSPGPPSRLSWLGLVGLLLVLALLGVAAVQAWQFSMLRTMAQANDERSMLAVAQAEVQYLRLREQLRLATAPTAAPGDAEALRRGLEEWRGAAGSLLDEPVRELLMGDAHYAVLEDALAVLNGPLEALLAERQDGAWRARLDALQGPFAALDQPLQTLGQRAAQQLQLHLQQRSRTLRPLSRIGLLLMGALSVLSLAFAAIAWHQLSHLRERRGVLEDLAGNLRQARREAEAASQAKSAFLANMSHEIRTPFHGLMGMLSLLREAGLTARQIDYLRTATESADHLLALLNDILDMSQLESGHLSLAPTPVALRALLRDVEALMRPQASAKALALHIDADPGVPDRVMADATRVRQILFNLLSNAIKFSERGAVVLDLRCRKVADHEMLEFIVTDTGAGIDDETLARLFSRFMQGDSSRQRRHGGSGLGLEISRNLARLMGGDITVRSKVGEGSTFGFSMPLRLVPGEAEGSAEDSRQGAPLTRPLRVLVAEDHPVNRQYLAALLDTLGHVAHFTTNGEEAVLASREQTFDVVLMDLHMPVLDGVGATMAIRASSDVARATVPIVALTADVFPETRDRCMVAGMNDYLTKPVSPQSLASCFRRLFGAEQPAAATASGTASDGAAGPAIPERDGLIDPAAMALALQAMPAEQLARLIDSYLDQGPETVQRLRAAVRDAQPLDLRVHAHAAKGAALNLGLIGLAATSQALHGGAAHLPAHEIARLVQRFEEQLPATRAAAHAALSDLSAATR